MDINNLRKEYHSRNFDRKGLKINPFEQFEQWFLEALESKVSEPNAMALATATLDGKPSCRTVLLKHFDSSGLIFFTNYDSRKARELIANPFAAVTLFWVELERQVHVEGKVVKTSVEEAQAYFSKRPRKSQLSAIASHQDQIIASREVLAKEVERIDNLYKDQELKVPIYWGGFQIIPSSFEFWQGRENRLHDRFRYEWHVEEKLWKINRLSP